MLIPDRVQNWLRFNLQPCIIPGEHAPGPLALNHCLVFFVSDLAKRLQHMARWLRIFMHGGHKIDMDEQICVMHLHSFFQSLSAGAN